VGGGPTYGRNLITQSSGFAIEAKNHYPESKQFFLREAEIHDKRATWITAIVRAVTLHWGNKASRIWFEIDFLLKNSKTERICSKASTE
jgi:hypothetical protein